MAHKNKTPAAGSTAAGARGKAVSENTSSIAQTVAAAKGPAIASIRRGPGGKADWLVSIEGVCTDTPFRDRKLRRHRRFCNIIWHRFGVNFDPMPQADWSVIVEAAIGGAP
jgi:hypothetical protein